MQAKFFEIDQEPEANLELEKEAKEKVKAESWVRKQYYIVRTTEKPACLSTFFLILQKSLATLAALLLKDLRLWKEHLEKQIACSEGDLKEGNPTHFLGSEILDLENYYLSHLNFAKILGILNPVHFQI